MKELKKFAAYYKPHKFMFFLDMTASLFISLIGMVYPVVTNKMLNDLIPNKKVSMIISAGIIVLILYFIRMCLEYFVQYYGHMIGTKMQAQMRRDMFLKLESLPFSYFDKNETGQLLSRITNDLFDIAELADHLIAYGCRLIRVSLHNKHLSYAYCFCLRADSYLGFFILQKENARGIQGKKSYNRYDKLFN